MIRIFMMMAALTALFGLSWGSSWRTAAGNAALPRDCRGDDFASYWFSSKLVLKMYKARVISREDARTCTTWWTVSGRRRGSPCRWWPSPPRSSPTPSPPGAITSNAVGLPSPPVLLKLMSREEIEGVAAHELAHIQHRHMLVGTIAATMSGAVAMSGHVARWGVILGGDGMPTQSSRCWPCPSWLPWRP